MAKVEPVPVLHERERGCGYRKQGAYYMMAAEVTDACPALPIEMTVCPHCQQGIKPTRGWGWIGHDLVYQGDHGSIAHNKQCPLSKPPSEVATNDGRCGLIWVGEGYYKMPKLFVAEVKAMGLSRRVHGIPRGFNVGRTLVLLGHRKAIQTTSDSGEVSYLPGIFSGFIPDRVEYVLKPDEEKDVKLIESMRKRGVVPVIVRRLDPVKAAA